MNEQEIIRLVTNTLDQLANKLKYRDLATLDDAREKALNAMQLLAIRMAAASETAAANHSLAT